MAAGLNTYAYALGSPLTRSDRLGLQSCPVPDDHDYCYERRLQEIGRCYERYGPRFNWIVGACIDRAKVRYVACRYGEDGPPEWDDRDVDGWQPPKAPGRGSKR